MDLFGRSWLAPAALVAGLAWIGGILLVATQADSDPVGAHYDGFNRILSVALVLLVASAWLFARQVGRERVPGRWALAIAVIGFGLYLAGNLVEFWGAQLAGEVTESAAERTGSEDYWEASFPGFLVFLAGGVTVAIAMGALAVRMSRWQGVSLAARLAVGSSGLLLAAGTALWAVSPLVALIPAALFAFTWLVTANLIRDARERTSSGAIAQGSEASVF